jgi:hypothetical protein
VHSDIVLHLIRTVRLSILLCFTHRIPIAETFVSVFANELNQKLRDELHVRFHFFFAERRFEIELKT